jgi:hypothetical protein
MNFLVRISVFTVNKEFEVEPELTTNQKKSLEVVNSIIRGCNATDADCVVRKFSKYVTKTSEKIEFEYSLREKLAAALEEYSCNDNSLESSEPLR